MTGREKEYNWAGPYMKSHQVVAVNEDSDIKSLKDLKDKVIAVQNTTKPEDIIRSRDGTLPKLRKVISVQKRDAERWHDQTYHRKIFKTYGTLSGG